MSASLVRGKDTLETQPGGAIASSMQSTRLCNWECGDTIAQIEVEEVYRGGPMTLNEPVTLYRERGSD